MGWDRRLLAGTLCVEAVAVWALASYGELALIAVAVLYWLDLLLVTLRTGVQHLVSWPTRPVAVRRLLVPFRLLRHKRGHVTLTDRLPPVYPRNVPRALAVVAVVGLSVATTAAVGAFVVPARFWAAPETPVLLLAGTLAATVKAGLALRATLETGLHRRVPAGLVAPGKRLLLFAGYAALLWLCADVTTQVLAGNDLETARNALLGYAGLTILARTVYGTLAARSGPGDERAAGQPASGSSDDDMAGAIAPEAAGRDAGLLGRLRERVTGPPEVVVPGPPEPPAGEPRETVRPRPRAVLAAGVVNALTTGGVVDGRFSTEGLGLRTLVVLLVPFAVLAALDGAVGVAAVVLGVPLALLAGLALLSAGHMWLALGHVEYRLHDDRVVAYDTRIGAVQWWVPYRDVRDVAVERGLFGGPLWLDTGSVAFERTDDVPESELATDGPRASIPFVRDPERVATWLRRDGR